MKIALINSVNFGSTGKICKDLMNTDCENDYSFFYGYGSKMGDKRCICIGSKFEIFFHKVVTRFLGYHGLSSCFDTFRLIKLLKKYNPDIIHLHNIHGFYLNYKLLFKYFKKSNKKIVWTFHDCWPFTGHCAYFDYVKCDKWKTICNNCQNKKDYPKSLLFDKSRNQFLKKKKIFNQLNINNMIIISPSFWLDKFIGSSYLKKYNHYVINNGIDLKNFTYIKKEKNNLEYAKKNILTVASTWGKRKGYYDLVELSKNLENEYQLIVVGVSIDQKKELNKSNPNIVCIGKTNNQKELALLYNDAYVFVNPTYEDNFPTVNIESLCCGCPVITYNTGGSVESINRYNGIIVEQGNILELANAIKNIDSMVYDRKKISKEARLKYSKEFMSDEYKKIYWSLI